MKKFDLHPLFWIYMFLEMLIGNYTIPAITLASAILHELGHGMVATSKGYALSKLTVLPFGAVLSLDAPLCGKASVPIIIAGPIVSGLIALLTVSTWWIIPTGYPYTLAVFRINLSLAIFNLLPCYPLDGGRLILALAKNQQRATKSLRIISIITGGVFAILGLTSLFYKPNYSLLMFGAMLWASSGDSATDANYKSLAEGITLHKDRIRPIVKKTILAHGDLKLCKLLAELNTHEEITFCLRASREPHVEFELGEEQFLDLCLKLPPYATAGDAVKYLQNSGSQQLT